MARFELVIELGNDAMLSRDDVKTAIDHALTRQSDHASMHAPLVEGDEGLLFDANGNKVGSFAVVPW